MITITEKAKRDALNWIDNNRNLLTELSDRIWLMAEPPLQEYQASRLHAATLENAGFKVEIGVGGLDTAFVATYGTGSPVVCTYAEYDAVPNMSQMPLPYEKPVVVGRAGCYDMHHGIGAGTVGAAIAVKQAMEAGSIKGTLKIFGTPAEKTGVGKNVMERAGLFEGLDACVSWHPSFETSADRFISVHLRSSNHTAHTFEGLSTYNATPWVGRNALQALQLMDTAVQYIKDSIVPSTEFPGIASMFDQSVATYNMSSVPDVARIVYVTKARTRQANEKIQQRLFDCANAAALALGVKVRNEVLNGVWEGMPNKVLADIVHENIVAIGPPKLSKKDIEFGQLIQKQLGAPVSDTPFGKLEVPPPPGSRPDKNAWAGTDATVFCYKCPFVLATVSYYFGDEGCPDWATAALSTTNVAHQALLTGGKIVAASLIDMLTNPSQLREAKVEFERRRKDVNWYNIFPAERAIPKFAPLPPENYKSFAQAFREQPTWEGFEPELKSRMGRLAQEVLNR